MYPTLNILNLDVKGVQVVLFGLPKDNIRCICLGYGLSWVDFSENKSEKSVEGDFYNKLRSKPSNFYNKLRSLCVLSISLIR